LLLIMQNINRCPLAAVRNIFAWQCIPMGVKVIPIPIDLVSDSFLFPFPFLCFIPVGVGFPCDSHSHWESHSHAHLYFHAEIGVYVDHRHDGGDPIDYRRMSTRVII